MTVPEYKRYRRSQIAELADWEPDFDTAGVSISQADLDAGSPKPGDKIARNPANHEDRWLVAKDYFEANFEDVVTAERREQHLQYQVAYYKGLVKNFGLLLREADELAGGPSRH